MITITKAEEEVLNQIKSYQDEKIDVSLLKDDLGMYEHDLNDLLKSLKSKGLVFYNGSTLWQMIMDLFQDMKLKEIFYMVI